MGPKADPEQQEGEEQDLVPPVENPETQLSDFFNNSELSDIIIKNPDTESAKP